ALARSTEKSPDVEASETNDSGGALPIAAPASSPNFLYVAAAVTGFGFFLMELVWYRMLAPILGGSTFTFGIVLAVALAGISLGSLALANILRGRRATTSLFSWLCALEALCLAFPFALGDRIALWTMLWQPLGQLSFAAQVSQWTFTTAVVVFPAALVAGAQFPVLIALLGSGGKGLGTQTGRVYAWNTFGAVAGSLAGGFGLLPLLTAPGAWRLAVIAMLFLSFLFIWITIKGRGLALSRFAPGCVAVVAMVLLMARGPTAVWRHNPIGAGRAKLTDVSQNQYERLVRDCRQSIVWEEEGKESSVALSGDNAYAFLVNGKCDGNSIGDAGTQVMLGLLGALVHSDPHEACVIGLGTGSTAGWLAQVPSMRRVDVIELEPAIRRVAEWCAPVNQNVLTNPKVRLIFNDAREVLLTTRAHYDLIVSEPSNPYRAGVASLFTVEYYQAVDRCLAQGGIFLQWIQAYEIDGASMSTICATLATVFPSVEIWQTESGDLAFIAGREPRQYNLDRWRENITKSPFREALSLIWYVNDVEGIFTRFVANDSLCRSVLAGGTPISTDDRNCLEFAIARSVGKDTGFRSETLRGIARTKKWERPRFIGEPLDELTLLDRRSTEYVVQQIPIGECGPEIPSEVVIRARAKDALLSGDLSKAAELWNSQSKLPSDPYELELVALTLAAQGDKKALPVIEQLRVWRPLDAELIETHYFWRSRQFSEAIPRMERMLMVARTEPWLGDRLLATSLQLIKATHFPPSRREVVVRLLEGVEKPFAVNIAEELRVSIWLYLACQLDHGTNTSYTKKVLESMEPNFPWNEDQLQIRADCYAQLRHPLAALATADLRHFRNNEARPFEYVPINGTVKVLARERPAKR
ncbi:MAG TPA: fused MFS/spermidine synthase, partial [Verrucomicrobiae bacterium]|nr:fused MFS/spermidine synthase [Verrucomicrobiae bacterium]